MTDEMMLDRIRGRTNWTMTCLVALMTLGLGGAGGWYFTSQGEEASQEEALADAEGEMSAGLALHDVGRVEVNLKDAHAGRVLEMHVQIEVNQRDATAAERATAALRDAVIVAVSDYTYEDLEGVDGKARLKDELTARFGVLLSNVRIERLYLTQFVVR